MRAVHHMYGVHFVVHLTYVDVHIIQQCMSLLGTSGGRSIIDLVPRPLGANLDQLKVSIYVAAAVSVYATVRLHTSSCSAASSASKHRYR